MGDPRFEFNSKTPLGAVEAETLTRELLARAGFETPSPREAARDAAPARSVLARLLRRKPLADPRDMPRGRIGTRSRASEQFRVANGVSARVAASEAGAVTAGDPERDANILTLDMFERARQRLHQAPGAVTLSLANPEAGRLYVEHFAIGGLVLAAFVNAAWHVLG